MRFLYGVLEVFGGTSTPVVSSRSDAVSQMPKSEIDLQLLTAVAIVSSRDMQYEASLCKLRG